MPAVNKLSYRPNRARNYHSSPCKHSDTVDLEYHVVDQIALEGLDGITLGSLWQHLDEVISNSNCATDERYQNFIWAAIIHKLLKSPSATGLQAFYRPDQVVQPQPSTSSTPTTLKPRGKGRPQKSTTARKATNRSNNNHVQYNTNTDAMSESNVKTMEILPDAPLTPLKHNSRSAKVDVLLSPIQDGDIRGSCSDYHQRINVTSEIAERKKDGIMTLNELSNMYDLTLLKIVACQKMRERAVIPSWADPNVDLKLREYCLLETIGRSRYIGVAYPNMKSVGRYRIMLMAKGFLTQYQESGNQPIIHFLKRFALDLSSQRQESAIMISKYLLTKPDHTCTLKEFSDVIKKPCEILRRRFFNYFLDYFHIYTESFFKHSTKNCADDDSDKILMVKLKKPYTGVTHEEEIARDKAALEKVDALDDDDNPNLSIEHSMESQLISLDFNQLHENESTENSNVLSQKSSDLKPQTSLDLIVNDRRIRHTTAAPANLCYHPGKILADRSILSTVYSVIAQASNGLTELDIRHQLNMPKFHLRNHLVNLTRLKAVESTAPSRECRDNPFRIYRASNVSDSIVLDSDKTHQYNQTDLEDTIMEIFNIEQVISEIPVISEHIKRIKPNLSADWSTIKKILKHLVLQGRLRMLPEVIHSVYRERVVHLFCLRSVYKRDPIVLSHLRMLKRTLFAEDRKLHKGRLIPKRAEVQNKISRGKRKPLRKKKTKVRHYDGSEIPSCVSIFSQPAVVDRNRSAGFRGQKRLHPDTNHVKGPEKKQTRYDVIDTKARILLGNRRSSFSPEEDSFLLICRITSVLMEPRSRISLCVDKHFVRDLMHREIVEARDKTCDAILRRIKFLRNLPSNFMSVNEWQAELRDDPNIAKLVALDVPVENELKWNNLFLEVLNAVRAKISESLGVNQQNQEISTNQSIADASALADSKTRTRSSQRLPTNKDDCYLEIDDIATLLNKYKLHESQSLATLHRTPFYDQPRNVVDVRMQNVSLVTMAYVLSSYFATNERGETLRSWLLNKFYHKYPDSLINAVFSKLHQRLMLTKKCPLYQAHMVRPKAKTTHKINKSLLNLMERHLPCSLLSSSRPLPTLYKVNSQVANEMFHVALISSAFTATNLELMVYIPENVTSIDPESDLFKSIQKSTSNETISRLRKDSSSSSRMDNSRGALFLLRQQLKRLFPDRILNLSDCLVVHPCKVKFQSKEELRSPLDRLERYIEESKPVDILPEAANLRPNTRRGGVMKEKTSEIRLRLIALIENKRDVGVLDEDIYKCFVDQDSLPEDEIKQELHKLIQERIIFKVGLSQATYVHRTYVNHWLVTTSLVPNPLDFANEQDLERHKRNVKFFPRNWKKIDGTIDTVSLHKHFQSILSYLIINPGITRKSIDLDFSNFIPHEHITELLDLMEILRLIERSPPVAVERPRLFGWTEPMFDKKEETLEATQDSFVKVCQLLNLSRI